MLASVNPTKPPATAPGSHLERGGCQRSRRCCGKVPAYSPGAGSDPMPGTRLLYSAGHPTEKRRTCMNVDGGTIRPHYSPGQGESCLEEGTRGVIDFDQRRTSWTRGICMLTWRLGSATQSQARRARAAAKREGRVESSLLGGEGSGEALICYQPSDGRDGAQRRRDAWRASEAREPARGLAGGGRVGAGRLGRPSVGGLGGPFFADAVVCVPKGVPEPLGTGRRA